MSRPRPPLHDPYGLLRQPPPEASSSFYSATPNALVSTTSLPVPTSSPNRRGRQRGISPSRTQHGEEYDDQPYLTNVVRHHGQVTLVPPVNQGRSRKPRRRRNPEAAASSVSLADTLAGPSSSNGPSRVSAGPRPCSRPRQGSETRAVSSPDVRASPYPDYPPPSFEEVLALDRNNSSSTPTSPPTNEPTRTNGVPSPMFLVSAPPSLSDPAHNPVNNATPWEHDRLLGLSLEERVRREYERKLKQPSGSGSAPASDNTTSLSRPSSPAPVPSSPTATSVTASNFLTPQNLTPSPSGAALPLSTTDSPKASQPRQCPSPPPDPPKSPELTDTPLRRASEIPLDPDAGPLVRNFPPESQVPRPVELELGMDGSSQVSSSEFASLERALPRGTTPSFGVPLTSLLFTTRLRLDSSPERSPVREFHREISPVRGSQLEQEVRTSHVPIESPSRPVPFPHVHSVHQVVPVQEPVPGPSRTTSPFRNTSLSRSPVALRSPSPKLQPPIALSAPADPTVPANAAPEPSQTSSSTTGSRRPPPPPPPRPRQRQVGSGVAARISTYESLLANAPKVPPPIPPRPRPLYQAASNNSSVARAVGDSPGVAPTGAAGTSVRTPQRIANPGVDVSDITRNTHIATQSPPPRPPPRPASVHIASQSSSSPFRPASAALQDTPVSSQPQSSHLGSRPLPTPELSRPERPMSMNLQAQIPLSRVDGESIGVSGVLEDMRAITRPTSIARQATTSPAPASPQRQSNDLGSRSLSESAALLPERSVPTSVQAQALVPARIGPDGKLEIIPDAEVIWLDKPDGGTSEPQSRPSGSRTFNEGPNLAGLPTENMAGPSNRGSEVNPFEDSFLNPPIAAPLMSRQSSTTSSVFQPPSPIQSHPSVLDPGPSTSIGTDSAVVAPPHLADDFEYTDLDLLISRLEENEASRQGANYEQLLTVGEVLGPAHPPAPRPDFDLNVGLIEIQRRRVMKDGRVKLKLSLMGVGVDKCGICLTQFKNNESAVLLPCLHSFHTNCIMSWFVRQDVPACPHCRAPVTQ